MLYCKGDSYFSNIYLNLRHAVTRSIHPSSRRYSPGRALASLTTSLHCSLSSAFSVHCLIFITLKSATSPIHPSQTRSSFPSSYKQSSFHHPSSHCPSFHSLYMAQPSYPLLFYEFHNIFSLYKPIYFFIISNSPSIPLLYRSVYLSQ